MGEVLITGLVLIGMYSLMRPIQRWLKKKIEGFYNE